MHHQEPARLAWPEAGRRQCVQCAFHSPVSHWLVLEPRGWTPPREGDTTQYVNNEDEGKKEARMEETKKTRIQLNRENGGRSQTLEVILKQTCDGNLSRPLAGSVEHRLVHRHHVAYVALVLNAKDIPIHWRNKVYFCLLQRKRPGQYYLLTECPLRPNGQ